eukprot:1371710-Amorphochlora_amoeboformis.AAC.2
MSSPDLPAALTVWRSRQGGQFAMKSTAFSTLIPHVHATNPVILDERIRPGAAELPFVHVCPEARRCDRRLLQGEGSRAYRQDFQQFLSRENSSVDPLPIVRAKEQLSSNPVRSRETRLLYLALQPCGLNIHVFLTVSAETFQGVFNVSVARAGLSGWVYTAGTWVKRDPQEPGK